jgi:hypothetical protein
MLGTTGHKPEISSMKIFLNLTTEQVTLIAAIIAALASVTTLLMNIRAAKSAEMRVAYRLSMEQYIHELSSAMHSTVATAKILTQAKTEPAIKNWRDRAALAKDKLKELRIAMRYPLWGITDSMSTLTRLPDWIENARPFPDYANKIFEKGKILGDRLDVAILNSYTYGRPPTLYERMRVCYAKKQLVSIYEKMKKNNTLVAKKNKGK